MANSGAVSADQGRQLMNAIGRRLQQAGVQPAPEVASPAGSAPADQTPASQAPATQAPGAQAQGELQRAAALVRVAVRSGRVQASEGAEVLELLEAKGAQDADSLRTQHRKARARIQAMAKAGVVTPEQGRQLMNAIGRRLQQAGVKPADPAPAESGEGARPAPGPQPAPQQRRGATRRGTKTPNAQDPSKPAADVTGRPAERPQEAPKPARRPATRKPADPPRAKPQPKPQPRPQPRTGGGRDGR